MKPPECFPPDDPREWLNCAESNLALAKNRVPNAYLKIVRRCQTANMEII